jgi:hypothetical protein
MKLKRLAFIVLVHIPVVYAGPLDFAYDRVSIYATPWSMITMNNESPDKIRKVAAIKTTSSYDLFVNGFANELMLDSVKQSSVPANGSFSLHVVLDFFSGDRRTTFLSDGLQLCTEDLKHCIKVGESFRRRVDPSYEDE